MSTNTYQANGRIQSPGDQSTPPSKKAPDERVAIDGFAQVTEMLLVADDEFRHSLLKRLAERDPELAIALRKKLGI